MKAHNGQIILCEYDEQWPKYFQREAEKINAALGPRALVIEHVGSTSVPDLCAKPVIDILLIVKDSSDDAAYAGDLERAGYALRIREPDWFEHRMFKGEKPQVNLHVFSNGCAEARRMLLFRDWLRFCANDKALYARTKLKLASQRWEYIQHYADAKTEVVNEILSRVSELDGARV